ncbi:hypothetical protein NQ152_05895 [Microbacterium sp. zg.B48]|uniref:hypothetical protein n=1 Tax=Microbacterium sp. zg.B48 TaxID=2969408 RepID=UPI00214C9000|nr:hypothetical protein [Microbacterium sp. zg.B48]MCR2763040.1 hypothetical protein [Microbacterium sp. zg.B48]
MTTEGEDSAAPPRRRLDWLRAASDRLPTSWLTGIATGLFLVATAAFGGLATAAEPAPVTIEPGQEHRNDQFALTIERVVLVDELTEAGVYVEDGERVLAVVVDVENTWTRPIAVHSTSSLTESLRLEGLADTPPDSIARYDDGTVAPWLQPGVPAQLVLAWAVTAGRFTDGQPVGITLSDMTLHTGSFVANGQWWTDPVPAATMTVILEDIGAGG